MKLNLQIKIGTNYEKLIYLLGFYVPLTMNGNIIVDGMLASCYGSFDNDLAHIVMAPIRWFPEAIEWIFGEDKGMSTYAKINIQFGEWASPYGQSHNLNNK